MKVLKSGLTLMIALTLSTAIFGQPPRVSPIEVAVFGLEPNVGQVVITIFSSKDEFLKKPYGSITVPTSDNSEIRTNLPADTMNRYAISVYYDKNKDNKLNTNWFGIPIEAVGFSNNASSRFGPPSFEAASFLHKEVTNISVYLEKAKK